MIFQFLQNKLNLTSANMHFFFIIVMGLYLVLQIIDRDRIILADEQGAKYTLDRLTNIWRDEHGNIVDNPSSPRLDIISSSNNGEKPNFVMSALVSAALGLESWMLTVAITAFMPVSVVGRPTFNSVLGREYGDVGLQVFTAISVLGVIAFPIVVISLGEDASLLEDDRPSLTALAGSIIPYYSFIYAIMPLNTEIFYGLSVVSEIVMLVIGLILESKYGGWFGFVRGLLEYAVSFALFSSLLTFPVITKNFFGVFGFIIVVAAAAVFLANWFGDIGPGGSSKEFRIPIGMIPDMYDPENRFTDVEGHEYHKQYGVWYDDNGNACLDYMKDSYGLTSYERKHGG